MEWIQSTLRFMATEARQVRPGGEAVITRLADILVIQAIRSWIAQDPAAQTGWLGALQDRQIGHAISLIHRDPARAWTLASLAAEVAMSRSAFAARFTELVGEPAMHYLARWRMHVALTWLREEEAPLGDLALRLGYQSEAAFSRAFKRFIGVSPGAARRGRDAVTSADGWPAEVAT
jgi:AraC-like DNA-binding protein